MPSQRLTALEIQGSQVRVTGPPFPAAVENKLIELCRFQPEGATHAESYRTGEWDGFINLYRYGRFPVGLLDRVQMTLMVMQQPYDLHDYRPHREPDPVQPIIPLRDYQEPHVDAALARDRALTQAPTGAGKTVMFCHLLARLGLDALVVVNTTELVDQTMKTMAKVAMMCGVHGTSDTIRSWVEAPWEWAGPLWMVTTWQTLYSLIKSCKKQPRPTTKKQVRIANDDIHLHKELQTALTDSLDNVIDSRKLARQLVNPLAGERPESGKREETDEEFAARLVKWRHDDAKRREFIRPFRRFLARFGVVIGDEAHIAGAECVSKVFEWLPAKRRYGYSATPWRNSGDDLRMFGAVGDLLPGLTASELIRRGHLVKPKIKFLNIERMDPAVKVEISDYGRWDVVMREGIVENQARNRILVKKALELVEAERVTLIMCQFHRHGEQLELLLRDQIPEARFIHGTMRPSVRRDYAQRFRKGEIRAAVSSSVWNTGFDAPVLSGGVFAGPYKSNTVNIQRGGRLLRTFQGAVPAYGKTNWTKEDAMIYDTWDPFPYLRNWQTDRFELWKLEEEFEVIP
jgi:superfamily II DNA or RNA helicase